MLKNYKKTLIFIFSFIIFLFLSILIKNYFQRQNYYKILRMKFQKVKNFKDTVYFWHTNLNKNINIKDLFSIDFLSIKIAEINFKKNLLYVNNLKIKIKQRNLQLRSHFKIK